MAIKAKFSGYETTVIGDFTVVTDLKERNGVFLTLHDFDCDTGYEFTRGQALALHNFLGTQLLKMEVGDEE